MRTKTLLLTAALAAAGVVSSMAQVYSVNSVGYVNLTLPNGFSMIANPNPPSSLSHPSVTYNRVTPMEAGDEQCQDARLSAGLFSLLPLE